MSQDENSLPDDHSLMLGLQAGDARCGEVLCEQYGERLWTHVACIVGHRPQAVADIVQETFLSAIRAASNFDVQRGTLWAWLSRIAHNHAVDDFRRRQRDNRVTNPDWCATARGSAFSRWFETGETPDDELINEEVRDLVRVCLMEMPENYRELLTLKYIEGLPNAAIADRNSESLEATRSRLARARGQFRQAMCHRLRDHELTATPSGTSGNHGSETATDAAEVDS